MLQEKMPSNAILDACTFCQLSCPNCAVGKGEYGDFGKGYLTFENFVKFVEMNPFIKRIELVNRGEIFLNPELGEIIEFAHEKNVLLTAWKGVNFNDVSDNIIESLVANRFTLISVNLDGTTQESYEKYRKGGDFSTLLSNLKKLWICKKAYSSDRPILKLSYTLFEHNCSKEEIRRAKKIAQELDATIDFSPDNIFMHIPQDSQMIYEETGILYKENLEYQDTFTRKANPPCLDLWKFPVVNYNGRLMGCYCNGAGLSDFNVFELGLKKCLESEPVRRMKKMLMGDGVYEDVPCALCWDYRQ
ncbi:MAG: hypothetical protein LBB29_03860, partial [Holosporaceae bacterium]|nr:hypothetical protein [Holosporaceae bacterium]